MEREAMLRTLIKMYGGTQEAFATKIGVTQPTVANWLYRKDLPAHAAAYIYKACPEISFDWLMTGEGEMYNEMVYAPFYRETIVKEGTFNFGPLSNKGKKMCVPGVTAQAYIQLDGCNDGTLRSGDIVGVIEQFDYITIDPTKKYLIYLTNDKRLIRHIQPSSKKDDTLELLSDDTTFRPYIVNKKDVAKVFRIEFEGRYV